MVKVGPQRTSCDEAGEKMKKSNEGKNVYPEWAF